MIALIAVISAVLICRKHRYRSIGTVRWAKQFTNYCNDRPIVISLRRIRKTIETVTGATARCHLGRLYIGDGTFFPSFYFPFPRRSGTFPSDFRRKRSHSGDFHRGKVTNLPICRVSALRKYTLALSSFYRNTQVQT